MKSPPSMTPREAMELAAIRFDLDTLRDRIKADKDLLQQKSSEARQFGTGFIVGTAFGVLIAFLFWVLNQ